MTGHKTQQSRSTGIAGPLSGASSECAGIRRRVVGSVAWLGPVVLGWTGLAVAAHGIPSIQITPVHLGWMILVSAGFVAGWSITICRSRRRVVFRWLLAAMTCVLVLALLEASAALDLLNWRRLLLTTFGEREVNRGYAKDFVLDRKLEFRRSPNAHWSGRTASDIEDKWLVPASLRRPLTFTYNRLGFRNPTVLERAHVALIGDSFVDGWYVSDEETVSRRLEARLGRPVANLGVAGYGILQELALLEEQTPRLKPAVVAWFLFEGNDLYDDTRFEHTMRAVQSSPPDTYMDGRPVPEVTLWGQRSFILGALDVLRLWCHPILPNRMPYRGRLVAAGRGEQEVYFADYAAVSWSEWTASRWDRARAALIRGAAFCRKHGIHHLLCYIPVKFRVYRSFVRFPPDSPCCDWALWPLPGKVKEFCRSEKLPFLDLTGPFREAVRGSGMPYAPVDSHWGPEGHALAADLLMDEFIRLGWITDRFREREKN